MKCSENIFDSSSQNRTCKSADKIYRLCPYNASRIIGMDQTFAKISPLMLKDSSNSAAHINSITDMSMGTISFPRSGLNYSKHVFVVMLKNAKR